MTGSRRIYVKEELICNLSKTPPLTENMEVCYAKCTFYPRIIFQNKNISLNAFCKWTVLIYIANGVIYFPSSSFTGFGTRSNLSIRIYLNQNWFGEINLESPFRFIFVVAWSFTICISNVFRREMTKKPLVL